MRTFGTEREQDTCKTDISSTFRAYRDFFSCFSFRDRKIMNKSELRKQVARRLRESGTLSALGVLVKI